VLLIPCPYCGPRPELEFRYGGHAHIRRDPSAEDDAAWAEFLFWRENPKGIMAERWRHTSGCGRFFNALRDTVSDAFLTSYRIGERRPDARPLVPEGEAPRIGAGDEVTP
jgi:sarcosine oxidase subunit delta